MNTPIFERICTVDSEGNLVLNVGVKYAGQKVLVTIRPVNAAVDSEQWQKFVARTAGSIEDPTFKKE